MRQLVCCILCLLICGLAFSPTLAGDAKRTKSKRRSITAVKASDNIFKYTNTQLTSLLKNQTTREVIARFGLPDRMSASVKKNKKIVYYKYGRTFTDKDKGVVFVNGKCVEDIACK